MTLLSHVFIVINALIYILAQEQTYPNKYDNIDVQDILHNEDLLHEYYKCFINITTCISQEMRAIIVIFSEAVKTNCKKCTEKQKELLEKVRDWCIKNRPDKWQQILENKGYSYDEQN